MTDEIILQEWRNNNENVNYPFSDIATLKNSDNIEIGRDLLIDARVYAIGATAGVYLKSISVADVIVTFTLADTNGDIATGGYAFVTGTYAYPSLPESSEDVVISFVDYYGRPAGVVVANSDTLRSVPNQYGQRTIEFTRESTEFVSSVVVPTPQIGVRGFLLDDGNIVSGDVYIVGKDGVVVRNEDGRLRIDIIGDPYALRRECAENGFDLPVFCGLKTINGVGPDDNGDFKITVGGNLAARNILRISNEGPGTIKIGQVGFIKV